MNQNKFNELIMRIKIERPNIILISGKIGSGKNYLTSKIFDELQSEYEITKLSFAGEIKRIFRKLYKLYEISYNYDEIKTILYYTLLDELKKLIGSCNIIIETNKFDELFNLIKKVHKSYEINNKELLRKIYYIISNDIARINDNNIWTRCLYEKIMKIIYDIDYIIISDCRKIYEYEFFKSMFTNLIFVYVDADISIRAKRRKISVEELIKIDTLEFEKEIEKLKCYADITIENN